METPKYTDQIFPKGITEDLYNEHLIVYSKTLVEYSSEIKKMVSNEYHQFIPFGLYLCPLCLKNHFIKTNSGVIGNYEFSSDHVPPKSAGGTYKLITCKKCNNNSGAFESELEKLLNFGIDKSMPDSKASFKVQVRDEETGKAIKGFFNHTNGEGKVHFKEHLKNNNKDYIVFLDKLNSQKIGKLQIEVSLHDQKKVERALLKSAYLLCFIWWGYEFVFSENGALIRDVIAGKKSYPCHVPVNWQKGVLPAGISIMDDGNKRISFLVNIPLKGIEVNTTASVVIPSPTTYGWANLSLIDELNKSNMLKAFNCITLPRIVDRIGYSISWNLVIPQKGQNT